MLATESLGISFEDDDSRGFIDALCEAFEFVVGAPGSATTIHADRPKSFGVFHLRDFMGFLQHLRVHGKRAEMGIASHLAILRALERSFGGLPPVDFVRLVDIFFDHLRSKIELAMPSSGDFRTVIQTLRDAVDDVPDEGHVIHDDFQPFRFKMVIDETKDGSAIRLMRDVGILQQDSRIVEMSALPGDQSQMHHSEVVSSIRSAAERPGICVVTEFGSALDGFYDMLNLRYTRVVGRDGHVSFLATVAAGSFSVLAPVHPRFQLIVCVRAADLPHLPLPLLNRFEKYRISVKSAAIECAAQLTSSRIRLEYLQDAWCVFGVQTPPAGPCGLATILSSCHVAFSRNMHHTPHCL